MHFLFIDNANFGSCVMEQIKQEYPEINKNLHKRDISFTIYKRPDIINRYIDIYLFILFYFNEQGIPLNNMIFFRDCNHSSNWRRKLIEVYKEGKSRFADKTTFQLFDIKDTLLKQYENQSLTLFEKWEIEDKLDDIKLKFKENERFIHDLASIERCIHFFLNDNVCHLSERSCCEADEQMYIFGMYLLQKYPSSKIHIVSNDTDMYQCISNNTFIHDLMKTISTPDELQFRTLPYSEQGLNQIDIYKITRVPSEYFHFKSIKEYYRQSVLDQIIIHKVCCGKRNDNLPDPSTSTQKLNWFGTVKPDIYKTTYIQKDKIIQECKQNKSFADKIKHNIICSSFQYIPMDVVEKVVKDAEKIENKSIERDGGFKPPFYDNQKEINQSTFIDILPSLRKTVLHWMEESYTKYYIEFLISITTKHIGRDIIRERFLEEDYYSYLQHQANEWLTPFYPYLKDCNYRWIQKYLYIYVCEIPYVCDKTEFSISSIYVPFKNYIRKSYIGEVDLLQTYVQICAKEWLTLLK